MRNNKITILSEQFQNAISEWQKEAKSIPLVNKYVTAYFPGLVQALQLKVAELNCFLGSNNLNN